jgi:RNA polymerase sigma-70 factor, ECF subfamily
MPTAAALSLDNPATCSDPELVVLATEGNESAIRTIVQRYNRRLYRVVRAVLQDDAEAEDALQETYLKALTNLKFFRGDAALSTWLTRIALNEALARLRRRRSRTAIEARETEGERVGASLIMFPSSISLPNPETEMARGQIRDLLEKTVNELPEPFRLVFILRDVEELSIEETATQLSLKPQTVKTRLHRARRLIRTALDRHISSEFSELFPFGGARCARMATRVIQQLRQLQPPVGAM